MAIITIDKNNIETEHIGCAIADKKGEYNVASKKAWMTNAFNDGLVFKKLDVRGKVLIEYIPAENAWMPVDAPDYMMINCFWVSGKYKGQGHANALLKACISDAKAKGKVGICVLSSKIKKPFLSDPKYLKHKGFLLADEALSFFTLLYLPFSNKATKPQIKPCAKLGTVDRQGIVICYTNQCPFTEKYVGLCADIAKAHDAPFKAIKLETKQEARKATVPATSYALFYNGQFMSNEIYSQKKFETFLQEKGL